VTDGGTLRWQRIRLHSLDAPELWQACDGRIWPAGKLARDALSTFLAGRQRTGF
jgi:endonuclease YncB( thermonuclease family)